MPRKVVKNRAGNTWTESLYQELHNTFKVVEYKELTRIKPSKGVRVGEASGYKNTKGYIVIQWKGFEKHGLSKVQYAHRVIYFMSYKEMPEMIDHIDGDKSNNHVLNLRPSDNRLNQLNRHKKVGVDTDLPIGVYTRERKGRKGIWYEVKYQNGNIRKSTYRRDKDSAINLIKEWRATYG
jgi:hypothetical protein